MSNGKGGLHASILRELKELNASMVKQQQRMYPFMFVAIVVFAICAFFYWRTVGPMAAQAQQRLTQLESESFHAVVLRPASTSPSLFPSEMVIKDQAVIQDIVRALSDAGPGRFSHPIAAWYVQLELKGDREPFRSTVMKTNQGVLVRLFSGRDGDGWVLGTYQADELAAILERIAPR